jgi:3-phenylpropionate/trans-cinnamate dioxygenase ferredoxin subunit
MSEFVKVAKVSDIPDPGKITLEVDDRLVVVAHVDGKYYCIDDVCTHDGGPLGDGELCGFELACPRHGSKFDVRSGIPSTMPATERTESHQVKIVGEDILVSLNNE